MALWQTDRQIAVIDSATACYVRDFMSAHDLAFDIIISQENGALAWQDGTLFLYNNGKNAAPAWDKMRARVLKAGRKNEAILAAAKPSKHDIVIDAMAGFGHDGLILASSGAYVVMVERRAAGWFLLYHERARLLRHLHWHKILGRVGVILADAHDVLSYLNHKIYKNNHNHHQNDDVNANGTLAYLDTLDLNPQNTIVYLDPMFAKDSFNAKVGKTMQVLDFVAPMGDEALARLVSIAMRAGKKVVLKRAPNAPTVGASSFCVGIGARFDVYLS